MTCSEPRVLVQAYLDHELDVSASLEMEEHLRDCSVCSAEYEAGRGVRAALAKGDLYSPASAIVRRRIRGRWRTPALAASLAIAALAVLIVLPTVRRPVTDSADEIVAGHVRSLMVDHLTDVTSTDKHTVKPWFEGKLDFAPTVVDLADQGFPLVGGRLDYLVGRPAAALVYGRQRHFVNLFVQPATAADGAEGTSSRQGFQIVRWHQAGMSYSAVSDLNGADLGEFAALFRERTAPSR